ncbi:MAG: hypothetical protein AAFY69_05025 [Pseudomonadota bacterium]
MPRGKLDTPLTTVPALGTLRDLSAILADHWTRNMDHFDHNHESTVPSARRVVVPGLCVAAFCRNGFRFRSTG